MLETPRLVLAPVVPTDTDAIAALYSDPDVMRYVTERPLSAEFAAASVAKGIQHWADHGHGMFSVFQRESGAFIGRCGIVRMGATADVEVAYILRKDFWGQGYATEAASACVELGFARQGLSEIFGLTFLDNTPSQRVLEKCGLRFCGTRFHHPRHLLLFSRTAPF
jgi:ribosomal-protein-alanine N-acetyltransferase